MMNDALTRMVHRLRFILHPQNVMANTSAIRAGRAFVEIFGDDSKLVRTLRGAEGKLKAWGASVQAIGAKVFAAGVGLLAPMIASVKSFMSTGDPENHSDCCAPPSEKDVAVCGTLAAGPPRYHLLPAVLRGRFEDLPEGPEALSRCEDHSRPQEVFRRR